MVKYLKQRNSFSCGPIAIINAYKWLGLKYSYKNLKELEKELDCDSSGTSHESIHLALLFKFNKVNRYQKPLNIDKIISNFENKNNAMVLSFAYQEFDQINMHVCFVSEYKDKKFYIHNYSKLKAHYWISEQELSDLVNLSITEPDGSRYPNIWLIEK